MGIKVDAFKQFDTFYYKAGDETEPVHKKLNKHKQSKTSKPDKNGKFPKDIREKILADAVAEIDKEKEGTGLPKVLATDEIQRSRPGGYHIKNVRQPLFPSLPKGAIHSQEDTSEIATREQTMKQWAVSTEVQKPWEFQILEGDTRAEPGVVDKQAVSCDIAVVITEQPQKPADNSFMGKRQRESSSESKSKKGGLTKRTWLCTGTYQCQGKWSIF